MQRDVMLQCAAVRGTITIMTAPHVAITVTAIMIATTPPIGAITGVRTAAGTMADGIGAATTDAIIAAGIAGMTGATTVIGIATIITAAK